MLNKDCNKFMMNKCEKNFLDSRVVKLDEFKLVLKYQKIRSKIIYTRRKIEEISEQLKKVKNRIKGQEYYNEHIKIFFNKLKQKQQNKKK